MVLGKISVLWETIFFGIFYDIDKRILLNSNIKDKMRKNRELNDNNAVKQSVVI